MTIEILIDPPAVAGIEGRRGSLAERVYQILRDAILTMAYPPGMVLKKAEICAQLGVSRSPASEALARLAAEGLVDIIPQSGTRVSRFSMEAIREATFLREALETAAVARVALQHSEAQLAAMARTVRLHELLLQDRDFAGIYQADEEFHAQLMQATGFPGLASVVADVSLQLKRARLLLLPEEGRAEETLHEHRAILAAVQAGDAEAARRAMSGHLSQLIARIEPLEKKYPEIFRGR